jgi:hypothetical protein
VTPFAGALPPSTTAGGAAAFSARAVTGCERGHRTSLYGLQYILQRNVSSLSNIRFFDALLGESLPIALLA